MKSKSNPALIQVVSAEQVKKWREKASEMIAQARFRQAIQILNQALSSNLSLVEQIQFLGCRAYAHSLWRKPEEAIEDASRLLSLIQAEVIDLCFAEIDWEYERTQDTGYLAFLAAIYNLRGTLRRSLKLLPEAVEDLTLALLMSKDPQTQGVSLLQRAFCLLQLGECQERALVDLSEAWQSYPEPMAAIFKLSVEDAQELQFSLNAGNLEMNVSQEMCRVISASEFELKVKDLQADILAFSWLKWT
jgi:tetratricopeptide (TPR) repeat protein